MSTGDIALAINGVKLKVENEDDAQVHMELFQPFAVGTASVIVDFDLGQLGLSFGEAPLVHQKSYNVTITEA